MVTVSPQMRSFFQKLERIARTESTVLIRGDSGTGKELAAHAIHRCSRRRAGAYRALNCATLTSELLASELFGHVRGAFTGAIRDRRGLFSLADHGTLFLDEIGEIPLDIQARLLRVLQERTFVPLGGTEPLKADVRVVSATNKSLREEVDSGRFREDLMYRVRVVVLYLPALREREGDVEALTWHFIQEFNQQGYRRVEAISEEAMATLKGHTWPGNVRELRNNVEQAFAMGEGPLLELDDLSPELQGIGPAVTHASADTPRTWEEVERERILEALSATGGRRAPAADRLGMSRSTLWRKMKALGIA